MYDPDKFEKIVMNLLSNAFKYTPVNETIQLVFKVDEPAGAIRLWVNDTGPGIPPELQPNIFDRFYRLRTDRNVRIPGSGIGLSLVKELVEIVQRVGPGCQRRETRFEF
jgi:signal transduction histidine kinase